MHFDKFPNFCNFSLSSFFKRNILFASILISSSVPESVARLSITDVSADRSSDDGLHQGSSGSQNDGSSFPMKFPNWTVRSGDSLKIPEFSDVQVPTLVDRLAPFTDNSSAPPFWLISLPNNSKIKKISNKNPMI